MGALLAYAGIQAGAAVGKWAYNKYVNKKPGFDQTPYGKRLKMLSNQGSISPLAKDNILAKTSKVAGQNTANNTATYQGQLANAGMLGSVAGMKGEADIRTTGNQAVLDKATDIETKNELTKASAKDQFAFQKSNYQEGIRQMNSQNNANLVGSLIETAGSYAGTKLTQPKVNDLDLDDPGKWTSWLAEQPDQGQAMEVLQNMSRAKYFGDRWKNGKNAEPTTVSVIDQFRNDGNQTNFFARLFGLGLDKDQIRALLMQLDKE